MESREYYDILLLGKTGTGKSSTGNKLLCKSGAQESSISRYYNRALHFLKGPPEHEPTDKKAFATAEDVDEERRCLSITGWCEVLANDETQVRVLDVPGFSDSGALERTTGQKVGVVEGNLHIIRWIVRVQATMKLGTDLVLYFLPTRGALEKADKGFIDELKVIHHYFGPAIFESMVVVATNHARKQKYGFDDEDREETGRVLETAMKIATGDDNIIIPPLVYIAVKDSGKEILDSLRVATAKSKTRMELKFRDDVCAKCAVLIRSAKPLGSKALTRVGVVNSNDETTKYEDSKCHTKFVARYTTAQKFLGGLGHLATLGIPYIALSKSWPGWTNSDEMCESCECGPGSKGCKTVGDGKVVDHTNRV